MIDAPEEPIRTPTTLITFIALITFIEDFAGTWSDPALADDARATCAYIRSHLDLVDGLVVHLMSLVAASKPTQ